MLNIPMIIEHRVDAAEEQSIIAAVEQGALPYALSYIDNFADDWRKETVIFGRNTCYGLDNVITYSIHFYHVDNAQCGHYVLTNECYDWLIQNCGNTRWRSINRYTGEEIDRHFETVFFFESITVAVHFKLRWYCLMSYVYIDYDTVAMPYTVEYIDDDSLADDWVTATVIFGVSTCYGCDNVIRLNFSNSPAMLTDECHDWLIQNCGNTRWRAIQRLFETVFFFESATVAVHFKLRWY